MSRKPKKPAPSQPPIAELEPQNANPRRNAFLALGIVLMVFAAIAYFAWPQAPTPKAAPKVAQSPKYLGSVACAECHAPEHSA